MAPYSSRIMHHVTKLESFQIWFLKHDNEFSVIKLSPHSPDLNPIEHLRDVVEWELCAMDLHPTNLNCKMLSYQQGPAFLKNAFSTLLNQFHVELWQF